MTQADIARLIQTHRDELVQSWVQTVRADQSIQSDAVLSDSGLIDHVPVLLDEVCAMLRAGEQPGLYNMHEARVHAYTRLRQSYRARDLVREVALLRLLLIKHINDALTDELASVPIQEYFTVMHSLNLYLDEELRYAVAIFTEGVGALPQPALV